MNSLTKIAQAEVPRWRHGNGRAATANQSVTADTNRSYSKLGGDWSFRDGPPGVGLPEGCKLVTT